MKMKKFLKIITLAISFLTAGFSFGLTGDIYEIFPCDQDGNYKDYGASVENPIRQRGIDNPLYFCVRLISRTSEPEDSAWQMEHRDSVVERPWQLGIFVSGEEKRATLEQCKRNANNGAFTDLIFSYQPKAGDVALPIVFATKNGPAFNNVTGESEDERISLYKSGKNVIFNKRGDELRFWLWNSNPDNPIDPGTPNPSGERSKDYTLLNCGFYVKTLEFVKEADPITIKRGEERQLAIKVANGTGDPLGSENPVKLYVWTTNDNVEASRNTLDVEIKLDDKGNKWSTKVGVVEFEVGQSQSYFYIKGIKENPETDPDKTIDLFLSPYPNFNYFSAGDRILDYETMKVKCSGVSEPEVIIEVPSEVTANGDYTNSVAAVKVRLNQPLVSGTELKLRINPTYADGGTADGIYDYIRFSTKPAFQGQPNDGAMELTFSGTEIEKIFYLYCYDAPNSIILTPEAIGTTDYKLTPITFNILAGKPKILEPQADLEKAYITGSVNEDIPLRIKISDVRAHEKDDGKKYRYKIWYMRPNDLEYQEMDGVYYCATGGYLLKLKYDEKTDSYTQTTEQPAIQFLGSGENLNCSIYVALDDTLAETSDVRSFTANIKPPRTITLTPNYSTFDEGEHVTFDIKLSEALEGGMPIYGYLKASITDDSVQEKFESDEPNSYDVILGINGTKKNEKGETVTNEVNGVQFFGTEASCSFLLKDGYAGTGLKVSFEVILSYDAAWDVTVPLTVHFLF